MSETKPAVVAKGAESSEYSFFGEDQELWSVHVKPAPENGAWEVIALPIAELKALSEKGTVVGCARDDDAFIELQRALLVHHSRLNEPLPHLPMRPSLLASSGTQNRTSASELQAYMAALTSHPEVPSIQAFVDFVSGCSVASTGVDAAPAAKAPELALPLTRRPSEPSLVKVPSPAVVRKGTGNSGRAEEGAEGGADAEPPRPKKVMSVTLSWEDADGAHTADLPVLHPAHAMGNMVIDVSALAAKTGFFTHDPGFTSTSSCMSAITYIDGARGVLLHRGYAIEQLARTTTFPEVVFLLVEGELPDAAELAAFEIELKSHWMVHEKLQLFYQGFKSDAHPMAIMVGVVGALSAFYPEAMNIADASARRRSAVQLVSKMPTIAALAYKTAIGEPAVYPKNKLSWAANFLHMMFATPCEEYVVDPVHAAALETIFILHADHEQNASTSTVRIASSSQANPFACIAAGIASLWGPSHGGANEAVLQMLDEIGTPERIPTYLAKAKDKADPFRLMGFGHRVYKNFDPRATLMRQVCAEVLTTVDTRLNVKLQLAQQLEQAALTDEYFVSRKLYPNVDFYSGIVLTALGIPVNMFTVIFAVARCAGWLAQWNESFMDAQQRISRPRQLYTGSARRDFVPLEKRGAEAPR